MKNNSGEGQLEDRLDARQVRSRRALHAALLALLQEKPFDRITIREIAARAGTGYATFFRHYPGKEALLEDVAAAEIAAMIEHTVPLISTEDSAELTLALCHFVTEHRGLWAALLTGGASGILREELLRQALEVPATVDNAFTWLPRELMVTITAGGVLDVLAWWLGRAPDRDAEEIAAIIDRMLIRPMMGKPIAREMAD